MKAMIFAAGIGSRLKPFTDSHPKALVPVGDKPIIYHVIKRMIDAGITDITINVHHFANQIIEYVKSLKDLYADFAFSDESDRLLDTGGGLLKARHLLSGNEPVLLHNADILSEIDLKELTAMLSDRNADAVLAVQPYRHSSRMLYTDLSGRLVGWKNNKTGMTRPDGFSPANYQQCAFSGIHAINPARIFPILSQYSKTHGDVFSAIPFYLDSLTQLNIVTLPVDKDTLWFDVGRPESLMAACNAI